MQEEETVPEDFKEAAQSWVSLYLTIHQTKNVTPYIHALAMHVWEFIKLYGSLEPFSRQGLEKLNDFTTLHYMRGTNHRHTNDEALRQLVLKRNRIEKLEDTGAKRVKRFLTPFLTVQVKRNRIKKHITSHDFSFLPSNSGTSDATTSSTD
uniref:DUF4218 domain-containing protein n=1 Tax=Amphimedon queenslandica TaxID=400682 RepID=A0A1X7SJS9_AMPQE